MTHPRVVPHTAILILVFFAGAVPAAAVGQTCEWPDDSPCAENEFCKHPVVGYCAGGEPGTCTPYPTDCPDVEEPVCGCDRITYRNACEADAVGMSVWWLGPCPQYCGGIEGLGCDNAPEEVCIYRQAGCCCDLGGFCVPVPESCPDICAPVCSCDLETYNSRCLATQAGRNVYWEAECDRSVIRRVSFFPMQRMYWDANSQAAAYNVYRKVRDGAATDLGDCYMSGIVTNYTWIDEDPAPGAVWLLQVTGELPEGEGAMGLGEGCAPRLPAEPCSP